MITLVSEADLLDITKRLEIIKQIQSDSNEARKAKKLKAYEIYKDLTKKWVIESILKEFTEQTVNQMVARASNISLAKKIVNKKARCYSGGVTRTIEGEASTTEKMGELAKFLTFDQVMKKADRFSELLKNVLIQVIYRNDAVETLQDGRPRQRLANRIFLPHQYDPICAAHDPCTPIAYVLSDFHDTKTLIMNNLQSDGTGYRDSTMSQGEKAAGAGGSAMKEKAKTYIWWSGQLHFTTDDKGNVLPDMGNPDMRNPIGELNAVSVHDDQDDGYWCDGGDDLIDGSVLVNVLITDMFSIMNVQGWGQMVVTGKKVPSQIVGGPHRAITFEFDTGEPVPKVEFVSSNPPIEEWRECITMYVALLLSTNGLSTKNVSTDLSGGSANVLSGVAMMIDESESTESIEDKQNMFKGAEAAVWKKNFKTHNYLIDSGVAVEDQVKIGPIETKKRVDLKFNQVKPVLSETEKADILKKKKDSGLYLVAELLQIADPDLSEEEAEEKATKLLADRMKYAVLYQAGVTDMAGKMNAQLQDGEISEEDEDDSAPNKEKAPADPGKKEDAENDSPLEGEKRP